MNHQKILIGECCWLQGEAGTGNVVEAVRHCRSVLGAIRQLQTMDDDELYVYAKEIRAPVELVRQTKHLGRYAAHSTCPRGLEQNANVWTRKHIVPQIHSGLGVLVRGQDTCDVAVQLVGCSSAARANSCWHSIHRI